MLPSVKRALKSQLARLKTIFASFASPAPAASPATVLLASPAQSEPTRQQLKRRRYRQRRRQERPLVAPAPATTIHPPTSTPSAVLATSGKSTDHTCGASSSSASPVIARTSPGSSDLKPAASQICLRRSWHSLRFRAPLLRRLMISQVRFQRIGID